MNSEASLIPRKRHGRRYQFDPQSASPAFPLVADRVRQLVNRDRDNMQTTYCDCRVARKSLFEKLCKVEQEFIPPDSKDELDTRADALNEQLAILSETNHALQTMLRVIDGKRRGAVNQEEKTFTTEPTTTHEEQDEETFVRDSLREQKKLAFMSKLMKRSRSELERRRRKTKEQLAAIQKRVEEEKIEEQETLLGSDRKLLVTGVYRSQLRLPIM
ncbi:uncharacterized protein BXIN_1447 [Babesia sp. Xinjiang]|uniref:uncharacterized protein n=1 Tax=Babesia sp. Xinjiang TaxID=462227 RepID=UPI000A2219FA|nr:uncharacterized protein BXIN_1447 [Babesia sp. Xinjiang]ORM40106.1 hypothetical protein BXIN_1447 [Babesia sp. Xinjiang]